MDIMELEGKAQKQAVQYRKAEGNAMCGNCTSFLGEEECTKVHGLISPGMMCDLWSGDEPLQDNSDMEDLLYVG